MKRLVFLVPAVVAGGLTASIAVILRLDATATYVLFGVVAVLVVGFGVFRDLVRQSQRSVVVKMHEAAIAAEKHDGPIASGPVNERDRERLSSANPLVVPTGRTTIQVLRLKKLNKRVEFRIGHHEDPMPKQHA